MLRAAFALQRPLPSDCPLPQQSIGTGNANAPNTAVARQQPPAYHTATMPDIVIANPVLNPLYREPGRHFRFDERGITDEIIEARRPSSYFVPIPPPKTKSKQLSFETQWTQDRTEETKFVNLVRRQVATWRRGDYPGVTRTTRRLLAYWTDPDRDRPLFFCQVEALETAIYLTEIAPRSDPSLLSQLQTAADGHNPGLYRLAFKMATGTGKTVVMAMLIAWQALNEQANPQDRRFGDAFLVIALGAVIMCSATRRWRS